MFQPPTSRFSGSSYHPYTIQDITGPSNHMQSNFSLKYDSTVFKGLSLKFQERTTYSWDD